MGVHAAGTAAGWGQGLPGGPQLPPHHATTVTAPPGVQAAPPPPPPPAQMMAYPMQQFQVTIISLSFSLSLSLSLSLSFSYPCACILRHHFSVPYLLVHYLVEKFEIVNISRNTGILKEGLLKVKFGKFDSSVKKGRKKCLGRMRGEMMANF